MKLSTEQIDALDRTRSLARQIETLRKAVNTEMTRCRLPIRPVHLPVLASLLHDIDAALFAHELEVNRAKLAEAKKAVPA